MQNARSAKKEKLFIYYYYLHRRVSSVCVREFRESHHIIFIVLWHAYTIYIFCVRLVYLCFSKSAVAFSVRSVHATHHTPKTIWLEHRKKENSQFFLLQLLLSISVLYFKKKIITNFSAIDINGRKSKKKIWTRRRRRQRRSSKSKKIYKFVLHETTFWWERRKTKIKTWY